MAMGSGANESEAQRLNWSPSAIFGVMLFRASWALCTSVKESSVITNGVSLGFLGVELQEVKTMKKELKKSMAKGLKIDFIIGFW